jgi:hypothetical protein
MLVVLFLNNGAKLIKVWRNRKKSTKKKPRSDFAGLPFMLCRFRAVSVKVSVKVKKAPATARAFLG